MILTEEIHRFRETARHLWNTYLKLDADDDSIDTFHSICLKLFEEQIIKRLNIAAPPIPMNYSEKPLDEYRIFVNHNGKLPVSVNRDNPPSGYWDYPVDWIPPEEKPDIIPISFYDFDLFGWRKIEYYRVRILKCPSHPEINGRDALIHCDYVELKTL